LDPDEKVNETLSESGTVNETGPDYSLKDIMERLDLSILNGNFTAIDKSALAVKEFAQNRGFDKVKNLAFKIQLSARKNQLEDVKKLYEVLKQEISKFN